MSISRAFETRQLVVADVPSSTTVLPRITWKRYVNGALVYFPVAAPTTSVGCDVSTRPLGDCGAGAEAFSVEPSAPASPEPGAATGLVADTGLLLPSPQATANTSKAAAPRAKYRCCIKLLSRVCRWSVEKDTR